MGLPFWRRHWNGWRILGYLICILMYICIYLYLMGYRTENVEWYNTYTYIYIYLFIGSGYIWGNQLVIDIQYFDSLPFRGKSHTQVKLLQTMCGDGRRRISEKSTMCINVEECMKHCEAPFRWLWSPYKNNQLSWALFIEHSHVLEQPLYIQSGEWSSIEINMVTINHKEPNSKDFPFLCLHERFFFF